MRGVLAVAGIVAFGGHKGRVVLTDKRSLKRLGSKTKKLNGEYSPKRLITYLRRRIIIAKLRGRIDRTRSRAKAKPLRLWRWWILRISALLLLLLWLWG